MLDKIFLSGILDFHKVAYLTEKTETIQLEEVPSRKFWTRRNFLIKKNRFHVEMIGNLTVFLFPSVLSSIFVGLID